MFHSADPLRADEPRRFGARFAGGDRSAAVATALVAAFVGLAILKPWVAEGSPSGGSTSERGVPAATDAAFGGARPTVTLAPSATGQAVTRLCHDPGSWQTATIEVWRDQTVHVWRAIDPRPASGPLDPTIPIVPAVGTAIPAIGYCAPTRGPDQPLGAASIRAWRLDPAAAHALEVRQIASTGDVATYGALFAPPTDLGSTAGWPNWLVVFRYEDLATRIERWFAIEISGTSEEGSPPPG